MTEPVRIPIQGLEVELPDGSRVPIQDLVVVVPAHHVTDTAAGPPPATLPAHEQGPEISST